MNGKNGKMQPSFLCNDQNDTISTIISLGKGSFLFYSHTRKGKGKKIYQLSGGGCALPIPVQGLVSQQGTNSSGSLVVALISN
jgi:hypothetical protein